MTMSTWKEPVPPEPTSKAPSNKHTKSGGKLWIQTNGLQEKNGRRKLQLAHVSLATHAALAALAFGSLWKPLGHYLWQWKRWVGVRQMGKSKEELACLISSCSSSPRLAWGVSPRERILYKQAIHQGSNLGVEKRNTGAGFAIFQHLINLVTSVEGKSLRNYYRSSILNTWEEKETVTLCLKKKRKKRKPHMTTRAL